MDEESLNWLRFSRLIIEVGTDVLEKLVAQNVQTPFLNDLVYFWLEKVQQIKDKNYAVKHWGRFHQDLENKDETCSRSLKSLLKSWKLPVCQKLTFSEQVPTFEKWKNDIEKCLGSTPFNAKDTLLSWLKEIQDIIINLNSMDIILQEWTTCFLLLCQKSQQDLLQIFGKHFDDFLSSSKDKVLEWSFFSKREITKLESDREKQFETWKKVSERYFKSVGQNIRNLLISWKKEFPIITGIPELKKLLDELETETIEIDDTKLQESCYTWHNKLHTLFDKWLNTVDEIDEVLYLYHPSLSWGWREPFLEEIKQFPSISSQLVKDFFVSEIPNKKLQKLKQNKQLSEQQYYTLCPYWAFPDLKVCDATLLFVVLRNCVVYPPVQGWNEDPPESDQSLGADILRLKSCRKHIITHIEAAKIDQREYDRLWLYVRHVLCRLASRSGHKYEKQVSMEVDQMKTCSFNPEIEDKLFYILTWCKDDILSDFKGMAASPSCLNMLETIKRVERERFSHMSERTENYSHDIQIDEVTSIPQGLRYGWTEVRKYGGSEVAAAIWAIIGGTYGMFYGIYQTIFYKWSE